MFEHGKFEVKSNESFNIKTWKNENIDIVIDFQKNPLLIQNNNLTKCYKG